MKKEARAPTMKSRIAILCFALALLILAAAVASASVLLRYGTEVVTKITADETDDKNVELSISYLFPTGGYTVREVPADEGEYVGDGMIDYDGALGAYRIMIEFGDIEPHRSLTKSLSEDKIFDLTSGSLSLKGKLAYPSDHGFVLYIGSDTPIYTDSVEKSDLSGLWGTVHLLITANDAK